MSSESKPSIRRAEIVASLSMATDLAVEQPMEVALRSTVLSVRLAEAVGLSDAEIAETYWYSLLRYIGCNAEAHSFAALVGDEGAFNHRFALIDPGRPAEFLGLLIGMIRKANAGAPSLKMIAAIARGIAASSKVGVDVISSHCDVGQRLAQRLGFEAGIMRALGQIEERWDGRGLPNRIAEEAIVPAVRVANLARDVIVLGVAYGQDATTATIRKRRGRAYDPRYAEVYLKRERELTAGLDTLSSWIAVLDLEPAPHVTLTAAAFDDACLAMGDFADVKAPIFSGHSRAVAELAGDAARRYGLPADDALAVKRAGCLHDIGQVAVSAGIWTKPGALNDREWDQVRLHSYHGERVLSRSPELSRLGAIVGQHHERLDGSGYHRGLSGSAQTPHGRILAAAEAYRGMIEERPYRPALTADQAATRLKQEGRQGRLDPEAVAAVSSAAGHQVPPIRRDHLAGLTGREIDVLRLIARGQSIKEVARSLGIAPKTADNHIQNLYAKIRVRTRAGATLFAIERGLTGEIAGP